MLGNDMRVRRFNPAAVEMFHLEPAIIGRFVHAVESSLIPHEFERLF